MGKLLVVEGLDGAGKSTQVELLRGYLEAHGIQHRFLHFPRTESGVWGEMIARFLRGEFGALDEVDPYFVAYLYQGDRNDAKDLLGGWLEEGYFVLLDRYFYSNLAFQAAKIPDEAGRAHFRQWITALEYGRNKIPVPDLSIYLHLPFDIMASRLLGERQGEDRTYLHGTRDIHESDLEFQRRVQAEYLHLVDAHEDLCLVDCSSLDGRMLTPAEIHVRVVDLLAEKGLLSS